MSAHIIDRQRIRRQKAKRAQRRKKAGTKNEGAHRMGEKIPSTLVFKFRRVKARLLPLHRARLGIFELLRRNGLGLILRGISFGIPIGIFRALREVLNRIWLGMALRGGLFGILTLIGIFDAL